MWWTQGELGRAHGAQPRLALAHGTGDMETVAQAEHLSGTSNTPLAT